MDIITCMRKIYADYATKYGWLRGSRSDHITNNGYSLDDSIDFIDCPFKNWEKHAERYFEVVAHYRPKYAVAPDIYQFSEFDAKIEQAYKLMEYSGKVIVVPKVRGMADEIPTDFIIGYPMGAPGYSDVVIDEWELFKIRGRPIHLLGGSVKKQAMMAKYHNVMSVDGNGFVKVAQKYRKAYDWNLSQIDMRGEAKADEIVIKSIDGIAEFWERNK